MRLAPTQRARPDPVLAVGWPHLAALPNWAPCGFISCHGQPLRWMPYIDMYIYIHTYRYIDMYVYIILLIYVYCLLWTKWLTQQSCSWLLTLLWSAYLLETIQQLQDEDQDWMYCFFRLTEFTSHQNMSFLCFSKNWMSESNVEFPRWPIDFGPRLGPQWGPPQPEISSDLLPVCPFSWRLSGDDWWLW
jgi:hypothetical protein